MDEVDNAPPSFSGSGTKHILEIDSVELSFGKRVILSGVYLRVETGSVTALLGCNGCGKTCLMHILTGTLTPTFKSVRIDGRWKKFLSWKDVRYLPQHLFIPGSLRLGRVFKDFGLHFDEFADFFPAFARYRESRLSALSSGERRLAECYVILKSPAPFVMLDEPFSQIMPVYVETIRKIIGIEKKKKGILLTDHIYRDVLEISDRLYVMANRTVYPVKQPADLEFYGYIRRGFREDV